MMMAANRLSGVVSHRSAALLHGWEVKVVPDLPDVTVRAKRHLGEGQRDGVAPHWSDLTPDEVHQGLTTVERTLVDCLRSLPFDEALAIADSALRHRSISKHRLVELAAGMHGRGAAQARRVAKEATHLAANPFESVLRGLDNVILTPHIGGSTQEAQVDIGRFVAGKLSSFATSCNAVWVCNGRSVRFSSAPFCPLSLLRPP